MKNTKALIMIGVSVMVGLGAVFAAAQWVAHKSSMATARVVVAAKDVEVGTRLTPAALQLVDWPAHSAIKGSFSDLKGLDARVVNTNVLRGEPLSESKLAPLGSKGGLSAVIAEGKRAMTVKVNEVVGVAGFALPGNYVDIMVNAPDEKSKMVSKIVLEQILVLAVAQEQVVRDDTRAKIVNAVTLEVSPADAERLDLARSVGNLSLVLRNQVDRQAAATGGARPAELFGGARRDEATTMAPATTAPAAFRMAGPRIAAATPPRPQELQVKVICGTSRSENNFCTSKQ